MNFTKALSSEPTKLTEAPCVGSVSALSKTFVKRRSWLDTFRAIHGKDVHSERPLCEEPTELTEAPRNLKVLPDPFKATIPFNQEAMDAIKRGQVVPVWSELLGEWLYWVKGEPERRKLLAKGRTVPIYTLGELALVVDWPAEDIKAAHAFKKPFNGVISLSMPTKENINDP